MKMINQKILHKRLDYNKNTGIFTYKENVNQMKIGDIAGSVHPQGYIVIYVKGKPYKAHRLVWLHIHGNLPTGQIDHINGVKGDNRLSNLRDVSVSDNQKNAKKRHDNSSGVTGVKWSNKRRRWEAQISSEGIRYHLGSFMSFSNAVDARKNAEILYGFHKNHGR